MGCDIVFKTTLTSFSPQNLSTSITYYWQFVVQECAKSSLERIYSISYRTQSSFHYAAFSSTAAIHSSRSNSDSKWIPCSNVAFILEHNVFLRDVRFLQSKNIHLNTLNRHTSTHANKCQSQLLICGETKKQLRNRLKMVPAAMNNAQVCK